jgi:hypothetical protein
MPANYSNTQLSLFATHDPEYCDYTREGVFNKSFKDIALFFRVVPLFVNICLKSFSTVC